MNMFSRKHTLAFLLGSLLHLNEDGWKLLPPALPAAAAPPPLPKARRDCADRAFERSAAVHRSSSSSTRSDLWQPVSIRPRPCLALRGTAPTIKILELH